MGEGARRRRANAWARTCLALFGGGDEGTDTGTESTDRAGGSTQETSDGPETG